MELDDISKDVTRSLAQLVSVALSIAEQTQQRRERAAQAQQRDLADREHALSRRRFARGFGLPAEADNRPVRAVPAERTPNDWSPINQLTLAEKWVYAAVQERDAQPGATTVRTALEQLLVQHGVNQKTLDDIRIRDDFAGAVDTLTAHLHHRDLAQRRDTRTAGAILAETIEANASTFRRTAQNIPTGDPTNAVEDKTHTLTRIAYWAQLAEHGSEGQRRAFLHQAQSRYGHDSTVDDALDHVFPQLREQALQQAQQRVLADPTSEAVADLAYLAGRHDAAQLHSQAAVRDSPAEHAARPEITPQLRAAAEEVTKTQFAAAPMLQRRLGLEPNESHRVLDNLETLGVVGPADGTKAREVLARPSQLDALLTEAPQPATEATDSPAATATATASKGTASALRVVATTGQNTATPDPAGNVYANGAPPAHTAGEAYPEPTAQALARRGKAARPRTTKLTRQRDHNHGR
ncbi:hypothetical protein DI005_20165 [Prauserella sp. PE36]|uniref:DNA translocase FtsK n=1 Tax=Prauserella sp. PE36 TaxID=1504709 RepID=UPI000DE4585C|nr:DNA translocase FtsK [Prauserella sp. PE36]RBM18110.1 hypothetical protein DI005_20165 [Prauserella sp. PE36]